MVTKETLEWVEYYATSCNDWELANKFELKSWATALKIKGRSKMTDLQLARAIKEYFKK